MNEKYDFIVVGAGAAGLMAAGQAASMGARVLMLDKNARVGRKIMITGKGRCNVTNNCSRDRLIESMRRNPRFLYSAFDAFTSQDVMQFFEECGVPLKTERGARVFPQSDKAVDIVDALAGFARKNGVVFRQNRVIALHCEDGQVTGVQTADGAHYNAGAVLLATGGKSYPLTGSTGDGYSLAQSAGHTIMPIAPSLTAIVTSDKWCAELMGLSLKNVTLTVKKGKKQSVSEIGELMFTHFGISGPLVLTASSEIEGDASGYTMTIDLKPGLDMQQLDSRLLRDFSEMKNRAFKNALDRLLPKGLIPIVILQSGIDGETQINAITKVQRHKLCETLKAFAIRPVSLRPIEEAVVTRGGVKVTEVQPKTMESKLVRGLYIAGELLDVDAVTGGFNLQIAFSTGYLAGVSAATQIAAVKEGNY
ncbi:NAD(P)/FAD-dependent oxidoreductase [Oscillospiraceae bacterium LTW-04]|nr:NAD(P)/FAD-dependent oxidoreductase [Oscillospiraceae bacterium MB24-C1]